MQLAELKSEPQLVKVLIDDKDTIKKYGEAVEFYTWDRYPMETFVKFANVQESDPAQVLEVMREMVLDQSGNPIIVDKFTLPVDLLTKSFQKVTQKLGK